METGSGATNGCFSGRYHFCELFFRLAPQSGNEAFGKYIRVFSNYTGTYPDCYIYCCFFIPASLGDE